MSRNKNAMDNLKSRVLSGNPNRPKVTAIEVDTAENETVIAEAAKSSTDEGIDNDMAEFNAEEAANNIIDRVDAEIAEESTNEVTVNEDKADESTIEEVETLDEVTSASAEITAESQRMNDDQFAQFMARLKETADATPCAAPVPAAVKHSLIVLPANLELETPEELTRLMKNVQSKKCRSKAMGRKVEYEDSLVAEEAIKAAREKQGTTSTGSRAAELPEDLSTLPIEEIVRHLKNVQSKKCMAKAMGRTEIVANMLALEEKLKVARDMISPKAGSYHMLAKGVIIAKVEELRAALDALIVDNDEGDNDDAVKYNETFIEALEWAMSATIPQQDETAK